MATGFSTLINSDTPTLVDFHAEWCGPCKMMKPILEELHKKMGTRVRIIKIDIDKTPKLARELNIHSVPTLMLFMGGETKWRASGVLQASQLQEIIEQHQA